MLGFAQCTTAAAQAEPVGARFDSSEEVGPTGQIIPMSVIGKAAVGLEVQEVQKKMLPLELTTPGKIEPIPTHEYSQHSPVSGRVSSVMVNLGDKVSAGEVLLELESPELNKLAAQIVQSRQDIEAQIAEKKTSLDDDVNECEARIKLAQETYSRDAALFADQIGSQKNAQTSLATLNVAKAQLKAATARRDIVLSALRVRENLVVRPLRQQLHMLGSSDADIERMLQHGDTVTMVPVRSARSGVITAINASAGQSIDPTVKLFSVSDLTKVWATANIYESDVSRIRVNQKVSVHVAAYEGKTFYGTLSFIGDRVDAQTRTLPVRAQIANADLKLKPDMYADLSIQIDIPGLAVLLPEQAIIERNGHNLAFVKVQAGFQPTRVKVGRSFGDLLEVSSGLNPGQPVVVHGAFQLAAEMLKIGGDSAQFQQATEGDHEKGEIDKSNSGPASAVSIQLVAVALAIAFVLGFVISAVVWRMRKPNVGETQFKASGRVEGHESAAGPAPDEPGPTIAPGGREKK